MSWFARSFLSGKKQTKGGASTKLGHLNKLSKYLAKDSKTIFDMDDADYVIFLKIQQ